MVVATGQVVVESAAPALNFSGGCYPLWQLHSIKAINISEPICI